MTISYTTAQDVFNYGEVFTPTVAATAEMESIISAVSRKADKICTQKFSYTTYTKQMLRPRIDVEGTFIVFLPCVNVTSMTEVTLRIGNNPVTQTLNFLSSGIQYDIESYSFGSRLFVYGFAFTAYRESIMRAYVTYAGGWSTIADIPEDFQFAINRWAWYAYKQRESPFDRTAVPEMGIITLPGTTPPDITEVLNRYTWMGA